MRWQHSLNHIYLDDDPFDLKRAALRRRGSLKRSAVTVLALLTAALMILPATSARPVSAAPRAAAPQASTKIHPKLSQLESTAPNQEVDALVSLDSDVQWSSIVKAVGNGRLIKRWQISPTMEIKLPAKQLDALAQVPGVKWVTPNAKVAASGLFTPLTALKTTYPTEMHAPDLWNQGLQGDGVTVAVLDTGIALHPDLPNVLAFHIDSFPDGVDRMGHGTAVAGVVAGQSLLRDYVGIAPHARILSLKVLGDDGSSTMADVLSGLEWVNNYRATYNIRVVNLSLTAGTPDSYRDNPINAAVEVLWLNGVTVVAASGNHGAVDGAVSTAPGNDPFVITVGAVNDNGTAAPSDDTLASFSSRGVTLDGFAKPDVVAPGVKLAAPLAPSSYVATTFLDRIIDSNYVRLSGTSLASPAVAGAAALLLQANPSLTPDQIKWVLTNTTAAYSGQTDRAGVVNVAAALGQVRSLATVPSANQGLTPAAGILTVASGSSLDQAYWDEAYWDEAYWDEAYWDEIYWDE